MASRNSKIIQKGARVEKNGQGIIQKTSDGERRTVGSSLIFRKPKQNHGGSKRSFNGDRFEL